MDIPKIKPRKKQILAKPDGEKAYKSKHGIQAPENDDDQKTAVTIGTVIAVGSDPSIDDIKEGDRVVYAAYGGEEIEFKESSEKVDLIFLFDEDILGIIEK